MTKFSTRPALPRGLSVAELRWLEKITGISSPRIILGQISYEEAKKIKRYHEIISTGYPPEYILNRVEFSGYEFFIRKGVFIPRPESEFIVDFITSLGRTYKRALDLCCGTGALGISVYLQNKVESIVFSDRSKPALNVTAKNIKKFSVKGQIIHSNLFSDIYGQFDLIICNPPYISRSDYSGSLLHEPMRALVSGRQGIGITARFFEKLNRFLSKDGIAILETAEFLLPEVVKLANSCGFYTQILHTQSKIAFVKISFLCRRC